MSKFGTTKPNKAYKRSLEGTAHAPKKRRDPEEAYKTAIESTAYALKHQKDKAKAAHLKSAHDSLGRAGKENSEHAAVSEMALRRV